MIFSDADFNQKKRYPLFLTFLRGYPICFEEIYYFFGNLKDLFSILEPLQKTKRFGSFEICMLKRTKGPDLLESARKNTNIFRWEEVQNYFRLGFCERKNTNSFWIEFLPKNYTELFWSWISQHKDRKMGSFWMGISGFRNKELDHFRSWFQDPCPGFVTYY